MSTWFSASAVLPQLGLLWGLTSPERAWLTVAVQIGFVVGALVSSAITLPDLVAPQRVILLSSLGAAAVNLGLLGAHGAWSATLLRLLTGFFLAGVYPPALKLMATWYIRGRGTALGVMVGALTLGSALPHLINGAGGLDWRLVIVVTSALTLIGGLIVGWGVADGPHPFPHAVYSPRQLGLAFSNRGVRLANVGYFGHMWELYAMWAWFLVFSREALAGHHRLSATLASLLTFAVIGIGALGCWLGGVLSDRWGRTQTATLMMAISGSCALLVGPLLGGPLWLLIVVSLVWGLTVVADSAQFSTIVTEVVDQSYVGSALTAQLAIGFSLTVATIWLIPLAADTVGWRWAFAPLALGPLAGIWAMQRLGRLPGIRPTG
jgi:MFS family permease